MSRVAELIEEVQRHGGRLIPDSDGIRVRAPAPLPDDLMERLRARKPDLIRELRAAAPVGHWDPELAADGYVWCVDCRHWGGGGVDCPDAGPGCTHPDNAFRQQQPLAPRKCRWFARERAAGD